MYERGLLDCQAMRRRNYLNLAKRRVGVIKVKRTKNIFIVNRGITYICEAQGRCEGESPDSLDCRASLIRAEGNLDFFWSSSSSKIGKWAKATATMVKLFDSHCHLQDSRIFNSSSRLIKEALDAGVVHFAVNGVSEKDWHLVKEMNDSYPCVIPNFGLHPWFIRERTPAWLATLKEYLAATPSAAVGEIGLDKGSLGKQIDFTDQADIFRQQLQLAKELNRPASVHCVRAFGDLLHILKSTGPFPAGLVLHSYLGSAEMVPELSELGAYFSFSGFLMSMKESKARKMVKSIPRERILLETDAPDARPTLSNQDLLFVAERDVSEKEPLTGGNGDDGSDEKTNTSSQPERTLNHPANIRHVLAYVAHLLEVEEKELAEITYQNAVCLFSYEGSKLIHDGSRSENETEK